MTAQDLKVLVVDDNGMNRKLFAMLLKNMGSIVEEASSGMDCLELVSQKKYDVVFMDHMMPVMDGIETFHKMKQMENSINQDTPVIALTANDIENGEEYYLQEGFNGYLEKPILPQKLEKIILEL